MTLATGYKTPPLHKRYNEAELLRTIQNRYKNFYKSIYQQVLLLQKSDEFVSLCKEYYVRGFKDWIILGGVFNLLLNEEVVKDKIADYTKKYTNNELVALVKDLRVDANKFCKENMDRSIDLFFCTMLKTHGFQVRYPKMGLHEAENFFKERMNMLNLDLPHKPLFAAGGEWPKA